MKIYKKEKRNLIMKKTDNYKHYLIPISIGFIFFYFVFGVNIFPPRNISWLTDGDALQNYLGWFFLEMMTGHFLLLVDRTHLVWM